MNTYYIKTELTSNEIFEILSQHTGKLDVGVLEAPHQSMSRAVKDRFSELDKNKANRGAVDARMKRLEDKVDAVEGTLSLNPIKAKTFYSEKGDGTPVTIKGTADGKAYIEFLQEGAPIEEVVNDLQSRVEKLKERIEELERLNSLVRRG